MRPPSPRATEKIRKTTTFQGAQENKPIHSFTKTSNVVSQNIKEDMFTVLK